MKIGQNSDLAYHAWFKSCASFFENVSKSRKYQWNLKESEMTGKKVIKIFEHF